MLLLSISLGIGIYYITYIAVLESPVHKKQKVSGVVIPQTDVEEDVDIVHTLLLFKAADYFVYRGIPIGFQYEMLKELEKVLGRNMDIKIETDITNMLKELCRNNYDIVVMDYNAYGFMFPTFERSISHSYSYPVLVSSIHSKTEDMIPIYISGDFSAMVFFPQESPFYNYPIQKCKEQTTEELFEKMDNGEIIYMICDYNQAITLLPFYSNVQILEKAGTQFVRRWLLNKKNVQMNDDINHWLIDFKKTSKYRLLVRKYFSPESSLINASFAKKEENRISKYDAVIKKYAQQHGFDWRFIASIIYQETKFYTGMTGKGGSYGLMQLMPLTMDYYGITDTDDEEANIRVGIQHLNSIRNAFDDIDDEEEKLYFITAAYNAGRGHIFDARRLCAKYEKNYKVWNDVSVFLKLKSQHKYATDTLAKLGYYPGAHTVKYTQEVMNRYAAYKAAYP
jgi:membrane-bound lytic murein transglycosylase F